MNDFNSITLSCNVLLFAAGLGTRLRPFTLKHPKPALPLFNIPLGYYSYPFFQHISVDKFVVNTFYLPEQIHALYKHYPYSVEFSDETITIKGSAGGLKQASQYFKKDLPILLFNADEIFFTDKRDFLKSALEKHLAEKNLATLIVCKHPEAGKKFGAIWCENNRVIAIGKEAPTHAAEPWHFIGAQFFDQKILDFIEPNKELNIFYDVLNFHLDKLKVCIYPINCDWYEIGNPQDYHSTKNSIAKIKANDSRYLQHFGQLEALPKSNLSDLPE